jgi:hypothetical protein
VFTYYKDNGVKVREYRPAEEVFNADSLATLRAATVTVGHPGLVDPKIWSRVTKGHVDDAGRQDGDFVAADVRVLDGPTLARVEAKELQELSCGYTCRQDVTPGVWQGPNGPEPYDLIQRDIKYNHVALLPKGGGRAGSDVKLRLDGAGHQVDEDGHGTLDVQPITTPSLTTDSHTMDLAAALAKIAALEAEKVALSARADAADAKVAASVRLDEGKDAQIEVLKAQRDALQVKLDAASDPKAVDARVNARATLVAVAHVHLDSKDAAFSADGKSDHEVRVAILAKLAPKFDSKGKSEAAVEGAFEAAVSSTVESQSAFARVLGATPAGARADGKSVTSSAPSAYVRNIEASVKAHEVAPASRIGAGK